MNSPVFFATFIQSGFLIAMFEGNLLTPGQGALDLIMSLIINDLELTQLPFDLSCAISLFYRRTKTELNSVAPLYHESCLKMKLNLETSGSGRPNVYIINVRSR